jgi:hypothetical protein
MRQGVCSAVVFCLQEAHVGPINAELFCRDKGNVAMLLALLEDEPVGVNDFYVRYHTLQLLTALAVSSHRLLEVHHYPHTLPK